MYGLAKKLYCYIALIRANTADVIEHNIYTQSIIASVEALTFHQDTAWPLDANVVAISESWTRRRSDSFPVTAQG